MKLLERLICLGYGIPMMIAVSLAFWAVIALVAILITSS